MHRHTRYPLTRALALSAALVFALGPAATASWCACGPCECASAPDGDSCCCTNSTAGSCGASDVADHTACCAVAVVPAPACCPCQASTPQPRTTLPQQLETKTGNAPSAAYHALLPDLTASPLVARHLAAAPLAAPVPRHLLFCVWRN